MRPLLRFLAAAAVSLLASLPPLFVVAATLGARGPATRVGALALHLWSKAICRILGVRVVVSGKVPPGPHLFAANHLGYLDIPVLGSLYPTLFLSMAEVGGWPVVGLLARVAGTLFIDRSDPSQVRRVGALMEQLLDRGHRITLFPEGRATSGERVESFHSSLLEAAAARGLGCVPVTLGYEAPGWPEPPSTAVCWWGAAAFGPHARRLLSIPRIEARVVVGEPITGPDRKALARLLHERVSAHLVPVRAGPAKPGEPAARLP